MVEQKKPRHPAVGTALFYSLYPRNQEDFSLSLQPKEAADTGSSFCFFQLEVKMPLRGKSGTGIFPGS